LRQECAHRSRTLAIHSCFLRGQRHTVKQLEGIPSQSAFGRHTDGTSRVDAGCARCKAFDQTFDLDANPTRLRPSPGVEQRDPCPQCLVFNRNPPPPVATPPTPREHLESRDGRIASAESSDNGGDVLVTTFEGGQRSVVARCDQGRDDTRGDPIEGSRV
jgi:hypothetical protein